ncbi:hypothetical protein BGZ60DRAFT_530811 [Tricladium varicosporioides]|nr:hypothetical protein BGZ60DRAFT_530811 [Hymenoscyphus varicosporioides]
MSGIVLDVNWIPRAGNWPTGATGFFCGTVPFNDAACMSYTTTNIGYNQPSTFASCCNGPIVNITAPVTDKFNPSYGASCLTYCPVDPARQLVPDSFGDYWYCLSNTTADSIEIWSESKIMGSVTCGWANTSRHDQCEISVSIEKSAYSSSASKSLYSAMGNTTAIATITSTKTWPSCPAQTTASTTSTPTPTSTKSNAKSITRDGSLILTSILVASWSLGVLFLG